MTVTDNSIRVLRRRLIVRDSIVFVALSLVTIVLFLVTFFLFKSFSEHRVELAQRWYARGQKDLAEHRPDQAVSDLRTAISYAPSEPNYQLLLAQALSDAGSTDEAYAYFTNLWESQPGSGPLNLQLARLSAKMHHPAEAVHYYRAAVYGTWEGDGAVRRLEVRRELIRYLIDHKDFATARTELLIASGNASNDPSLQLELASLMVAAADPASAIPLYEKVMHARPSDPQAFEAAGKVAFQLGRYITAHRYLEDALRRRAAHDAGDLPPDSAQMLAGSARILELTPSPNLPDKERVARILYARTLAQNRLNACHLQIATTGNSPTALAGVDGLWKSADTKSLASRLRGDLSLQQDELQRIYNTEEATSTVCGAPTGDDALLLLIAKSPSNTQP